MLRHLPNALSSARILACPVLVALAAADMETAFTWLLVPALLSDIADGLIARAFHLQSRLGALLDSAADLLLLFAALYGVWIFHPELVTGHRTAAVLLVGVWLTQSVAALLRYGRLSSFHTLVSKAAGYLLGSFVGVSVVGNVEELLLLALLPAWRPDVRGLWWILRERRGGSPP